ncbi:LacI family DNA-binding transcriptional regulator [Microbacterium sp. STN6]|uniref:LacI family DNA-binding transcriptional regulator n=1 Tax=Microbacterium sp. STN6 TaxID=2995588 RepID=UPI002260FED0|nr:LacI family DNA-binding transcriptional regulator [Microbacterium sp. STN6]MCX7520823.1 LacI family DNA-binding transcriptional regulator [Microbacterium sp. STN6]
MSTDVEPSPLLGRVTITDVARAAGVSVPTVSKVVNGRYGVAAATSKRVLEVVEELGYETSLVASSLRRRQTNVIGILVAEFESFSVELLKGVSAAAAGTGYEVLAYSGLVTDGSPTGWERRSLSRLAGTLIDGAIIVTPTVLMPTTSIPVVAIDPHTGPGGPSTIDSDSVGGARSATRHLIELGHRRIAHIRGRGDLASAQLREEGYRQSLAEAGIAFDPELVRDGGYKAALTSDAARELLTRADRPTAVFAANDMSALGVLKVAAELGLRVPEDLSVIGFDDIPEAASATPPLTTMAQPLHDLGAQALQMLVQLLDGHDVPNHVQLPAKLVVRASTAAAPAA